MRHRLAPPLRGLVPILTAIFLGGGLALACSDGEPSAASQDAPSAAAEPRASATATPEAEGGAEAEGGDEGVSAAAREEARRVFESRCFTCHGKQGRGDGPASAGLDPQPRDLTSPAWQASVDDAHIEQIILYGGAAVGRSPAMPANPDLTGRPELVAALVEHVRGLAEPAESAASDAGAEGADAASRAPTEGAAR